MKKLYNLLAILLLLLNSLNAQVSPDITVEPFPFELTDEITITIKSKNDCQDFSGKKLYIHSGLLAEGAANSAWEYVIGNWGKDDGVGALTNNGNGTHSITLTPSEYYPIPAEELSKIDRIGMVVRSATGDPKWEYTLDGSCSGADYFIPVGSFQISFDSPNVSDGGVIELSSGDNLNIKVVSSETVNFTLFESGVEILSEENTQELVYSVQVSESNTYRIEADNGTAVKTLSFSALVDPNPVVEALPAGMRDGINYHKDDPTKATLVLHAPFKKYVFVKGDFNNWGIQNSMLMKRTTSNLSDRNLRYWITIDGLESGVEYAFQYFIDGELSIADPYTEKILDPWSDSYIPDNVYPNLKEYPVGKTEGICSVIQTGQEEFVWETQNFEAPDKENLIIYELHVRDFVYEHSYQSLIDTLDYLEKLNINAIELMPINEFEGNESWGYNPSFYFAPDKYYGTKNKLKEFIDEAHKRGIAVLIDLVLNHSYGQSPFLQMYMESDYTPTAANLWYTAERSVPEGVWGQDFDHESVHFKALMDSINSFWMTKYKVDGFRFDFTKGFSNTPHPVGTWGGNYDAARIANLKRMSDEIWKRNDKAYIILEHLAGNTEEKELANYGMMLWGNMTHNYQEAAMGWNEGDKSDLSWASYQKRGWSNAHLVAYSSSHDEERIAYKNSQYGNSSGSYNIKDLATNMERMQLQAMFLWTIPGPKMIWQFDELGYDISIDEPCRVCNKPILWKYALNSDRIRVYNLNKAIMKLKKTESAFSTTDFDLNVDNGALKSIILKHSDMNVVLVGNFDVVAKNISITFPNTGTWYNFFDGSEFNVSTAAQSIALAPGEYKLFTTKKLDTPNLDESISLSLEEVSYDENKNTNKLNIYPVPVRGSANIKYSISNRADVRVEIYNSLGQMVENYRFEDQAKGTHTLRWDVESDVESGIYFVRVSTPLESFTRTISIQ